MFMLNGLGFRSPSYCDCSKGKSTFQPLNKLSCSAPSSGSFNRKLLSQHVNERPSNMAMLESRAPGSQALRLLAEAWHWPLAFPEYLYLFFEDFDFGQDVRNK